MLLKHIFDHWMQLHNHERIKDLCSRFQKNSSICAISSARVLKQRKILERKLQRKNRYDRIIFISLVIRKRKEVLAEKFIPRIFEQ